MALWQSRLLLMTSRSRSRPGRAEISAMRCNVLHRKRYASRRVWFGAPFYIRYIAVSKETIITVCQSFSLSILCFK